jgi:hypothetical protein
MDSEIAPHGKGVGNCRRLTPTIERKEIQPYRSLSMEGQMQLKRIIQVVRVALLGSVSIPAPANA